MSQREGCYLALALVFIFGSLVSAVRAETYPSRPVRIVVPYGPGGIADVTMRLAATKMSERLGKQFIVDNRPGAGGVVALKMVASAKPDGYTLGMIGGGMALTKALFKTLPYDLEKDFTPISTTAFYGLIVATKAGSSLNSVADVIAAAKANPGTLKFGTINVGSTQHLSAELFRILADINVTMVPYKTTPDLLTGLLRGDIDVAFEYDPGLRSALNNGKALAIAYTGRERPSQGARIPTVQESGIANYDVTSWNGLAAPAATPLDIVATLNKAVNEAVSQPDVKQRTATYGMESQGSSVEELRARIKSDVAKWTETIAKAGIEKQ
jgi:tripartite-type tricarboxylate transporter receptor subunit TctC